MHEETLALLEQLAPDLMSLLMLRAMVLERISALQPVGRRALSQRLRLPEREIRSVCDALKDDGLIAVAPSGMTTTEKAKAVLPEAVLMVRRHSGLSHLEQQLSRLLNVNRVCIVPGDADADDAVLRELGRCAAARLTALLTDGMIFTVSGGSTLACVARAMNVASPLHVRVLPARGGMGTPMETQSGTLAAEFAHALGGTYSLMHLPDAVAPEALKELMKMPEIGEPIRALQKTDVLLYGVGRADNARRLLSQPDADAVMRMGAVGEALGCYFDAQGRLLYQSSGMGLTGDQLKNVPLIMAVAAGRSKAEAILSVLRHHRHEIVAMDEGAARAILEKL